MNRILLVARQEFRQFALTRGFWIALLFMPGIVFAAGAINSAVQARRGVEPYVVVDQENGWAAAVEAGSEQAWRRAQLQALAAYAQRWNDPAKMSGTRARGGAGDSDLARLETSGGFDALLGEVEKSVRDDAPKFVSPPRPFERVALPDGIDPSLEPTRIGAALAPYLTGQKRVETSSGPRRLAAAILIPRGFGASSPELAVQIWTVNVSDDRFAPMVRAALNDALQMQAWEKRGVDRGQVLAMRAMTLPLVTFDPGKSGDEKQVNPADRLARLMIPLIFGWFMFMSIQMVSGRLMSSTIEERASKLIDTLLSAVTPNELLYGKLLGMGAAGLLMISCWTAALVVLVKSDPGFMGGVGAAVLDAVVGSPLLLGCVLYYMLGFVLYASVFLAVGITARTMQEAQSLLIPVLLVMLVPLFALSAIMTDPNGPIAVLLTWIPLYTPYLMILRSAASPPLLQVVGATTLCFVFVVLVIASLGRIFRWSVIAGDSRPSLKQLLRVATRTARA